MLLGIHFSKSTLQSCDEELSTPCDTQPFKFMFCGFTYRRTWRRVARISTSMQFFSDLRTSTWLSNRNQVSANRAEDSLKRRDVTTVISLLSVGETYDDDVKAYKISFHRRWCASLIIQKAIEEIIRRHKFLTFCSSRGDLTLLKTRNRQSLYWIF